MSAQLVHARFNERGPRTSYLMGQQVGETLGRASDLYLQNKIQGYFEQQKRAQDTAEEDRQSEALASLPQLKGIKGLSSALRGLPAAQKVSLINKMIENPQDAQSGMLNRLISGGRFEIPQPTQTTQASPTPSTIAQNQAAAQRMSMYGQMAPVPGMPEYAQAGGATMGMPQQNLPFLQNQFQPAIGAEEMPRTQTGEVPPEPMAGQSNTGMDLASFQGKRLGEMSREQLDALKEGQPEKIQKKLEDSYNKQQSTKRAEGKESREERKEKREEIKDRSVIEKEPREYIKSIDDAYEKTLKQRPIYKIMESKAPELQKGSVLRKFLRDKYNIPVGAFEQPDEEVMEKISQQLLRGISGDYQGRILQSEVDNYLKSNPSLLNTPDGIQKLSKISLAMDNVVEQRWKLKNDIVKEARKNKEYLPEDLQSLILEKSSDLENDAYRKIEDIMKVSGIRNSEMEMVQVIDPQGRAGKMPRKIAEEAVKSGGYRLS